MQSVCCWRKSVTNIHFSGMIRGFIMDRAKQKSGLMEGNVLKRHEMRKVFYCCWFSIGKGEISLANVRFSEGIDLFHILGLTF